MSTVTADQPTLTAVERKEMCKAFVTQLDTLIDEFNAALPDGYRISVSSAFVCQSKYSIAGKHIGVTQFFTPSATV